MAKPIFIVCGLTFGDEGKGTTVDYLVRKFGLDKVIRFNGGPQAGHNVVLPDGRHHCFAQFGSGSLVPGVKTFLAAPTSFSPLNLMEEYRVHRQNGADICLQNFFIDELCPMVTPVHALMNRLRESARGDGRHGSCGKGVGEASSDADQNLSHVLRAKDLCGFSTGQLVKKLIELQTAKITEARKILEKSENQAEAEEWLGNLADLDIEWLADAYLSFSSKVCIIRHSELLDEVKDGGAVFEGAQGALLDRDWGFFPYVTRSKTGFNNALQIVKDSGYQGKAMRLAAMRPYFTRHGHGPFVTEDEGLTKLLPDCHNPTNDWQGSFRIGWFDAVAARYALKQLGGADGLVITNLDRLPTDRFCGVCTSYLLPAETHADQRQFFEFSGTSHCEATAIVGNRLDANKELSGALAVCQPCLSRQLPWLSSNKQNDFSPTGPLASAFSELLGVPTLITSASPTWKGKICAI
jgi:adenylosuccinate synthase